MTIEQQLRKDIFEQLKQVNAINCPNIYSRIQTPKGYAGIEVMIIMYVIDTGHAPAMAIPQIESEL